mmetsp:Transcript_5208/g.9556  ORF Transcript_5208/g.9556 Transcript_5208/m.9556 type:complete len:140 (+) Transcript_5208:70-489(+)
MKVGKSTVICILALACVANAIVTKQNSGLETVVTSKSTAGSPDGWKLDEKLLNLIEIKMGKSKQEAKNAETLYYSEANFYLFMNNQNRSKEHAYTIGVLCNGDLKKAKLCIQKHFIDIKFEWKDEDFKKFFEKTNGCTE